MITTIQFKTLDDLYQFYNDAIFNGELSECIVNMSRHGGAFGFFAANRWRGDGQEKKVVHEISINPDFMNREDRDWHSTLVHEMCHLWQEDFGRPSRGGRRQKDRPEHYALYHSGREVRAGFQYAKPGGSAKLAA